MFFYFRMCFVWQFCFTFLKRVFVFASFLWIIERMWCDIVIFISNEVVWLVVFILKTLPWLLQSMTRQKGKIRNVVKILLIIHYSYVYLRMMINRLSASSQYVCHNHHAWQGFKNCICSFIRKPYCLISVKCVNC